MWSFISLQSATLSTNATLCSSTWGTYAGTIHSNVWPATHPRCTLGSNATASWHDSYPRTCSLRGTGEVLAIQLIIVKLYWSHKGPPPKSCPQNYTMLLLTTLIMNWSGCIGHCTTFAYNHDIVTGEWCLYTHAYVYCREGKCWPALVMGNIQRPCHLVLVMPDTFRIPVIKRCWIITGPHPCNPLLN